MFYNEISIFVRNAAGIGTNTGPSRSSTSASASARRSITNAPPYVYLSSLKKNKTERRPDLVVTEKIPPEAATLYRLNGDMHPIHIDPRVAQDAGFDDGKPILHGLCTLGFVGRVIQERFCAGDTGARLVLRKVKVKFLAVVIPGQALEMKFWLLREPEHESGKLILVFEVNVVETGRNCVGDAWAELAAIYSPAKSEMVRSSGSVARL